MSALLLLACMKADTVQGLASDGLTWPESIAIVGQPLGILLGVALLIYSLSLVASRQRPASKDSP